MIEINRPDYFEMEIIMNRNRQENQGFFLAEPCRVTELLKEHDPNLQVLYNARTHKWRIVDNTWHCIMQVAYDTLDSRTVEHIKRIDSHNGYRAIERIREVEEKIEQEQQRKLEDMSLEMAKDAKEAFNNAYFYGRTDGVNKYVNGVGLCQT